ncbi:MAG TPA: cation:proton antiporter [Candidatus Dormibacteraeota bacterium]|nr:cation:proton antiporter [Candidatus Dormibacteraeota bacterium]
MHEPDVFLRTLAVALCVAAVTTVIFQRLRQPVVLGYLLAGVVVGPHTAIPLFADQHSSETLAELGVILLMFSLGLEFSLRRLLRSGATAVAVGVIQSSLMLWLGYVAAQLLGWTAIESVYTGAVIAISSTTIIVKAFADQGVRGRVTDIVFGVLIVEDIIAIFLIAVLTALSTGGDLTLGALAATAGRLAGFLAVMLVVGILLLPRAMRMVVALGRPETTVVAAIAAAFAGALLAHAAGYSVALGAFVAGALIGDSGVEKPVEHLVEPVRDVFAAVFFVAVGMLIDPALVLQHWGAVLALTAIVVVGKVVAVSAAVFLTGQGVRLAVQSGMSLAQIGEFSFIIAGVGIALGATRDFLYPIAVAVSAATTLLTPWLIRAAGPCASFVDRTLPKPVQTFAALYGTWLDGLRHSPARPTVSAMARRLTRLLIVDALLTGAVVIGASVAGRRVARALENATGLSEHSGWLLVVAGAAVVASPFWLGILRNARALGLLLGRAAMPAPESGRTDIADAPRRAFVLALQVLILLLVGAPLVAATQPFLPPFGGAVVLAAVLAAFTIAFWRSAANLQAHARAGAEVIVEVLAAQAHAPEAAAVGLQGVHALLPGLGDPVPVRLASGSHGVGRTLRQLDLRGLTGATALAIARADGAVLVPTGHETLQAGDVLALAGAPDAVAAARDLLLHGPPSLVPSGDPP